MASQRVLQFRQLVQLDPNDAVSYFGLGNACLEEGLWEEAAQSFKKTDNGWVAEQDNDGFMQFKRIWTCSGKTITDCGFDTMLK